MDRNLLLLAIGIALLSVFVFSLNNSSELLVSSEPILASFEAVQEGFVLHHSHPTKMSLQGKVEGLLDGNLGVKVSDSNSCSSGILFDQNFSGAIQNGVFNLLLGDTADLNLNYNKDYFLCLFVNGQQVGSASKFRGGQGQIHSTDVNSLEFGLLDSNNTWSKNQTYLSGSSVVFQDSVKQYFGTDKDASIFYQISGANKLTINKESGATLDQISINDSQEDLDIVIKSSGDSGIFVINSGLNRVGFSTVQPAGQVEIEARTNSINIPLLTLDQDDQDQQFVSYEGTAAANGSQNINTDTNISNYTLQHFVKVDVNGTTGWMPVYAYTG